jgi:NAD(P)-dependent dehydrogenase (short-subunit alcohol dehydrogenase family)
MKLNKDISAIVTGGASGLGAAVVRHLSSFGTRVTIFDMDEGRAKPLMAETGSLFFKVDVSDAQSVAQGFEKARETNGQERLVVNCAGIAPAMKTVSRGQAHDAGLYAKVIGVNLIGSFNVASQAAAGMAEAEPIGEDKERGVIINTASVAGYDGQIGQVAYASSKGGVIRG